MEIDLNAIEPLAAEVETCVPEEKVLLYSIAISLKKIVDLLYDQDKRRG